MSSRLLALLTCSLIAGCSVFEGDGRVTLSVADAPVDDATAVVVQFSAVSFVDDQGNEERVRLQPPVQVDLLDYTGGLRQALVSARALPAGRYTQVRFEVDGSQTTTESYVELASGGRFPLYVPPAHAGGLTVAAGFDLDDGDSLAITIDFDLRASIHEQSAAYELRPRLRLVIDEETGIVSGTVAEARVPSGCVPAVYAFIGSDVTPDDIDDIGVEPINSAVVARDVGTGLWRYAIGLLEAGAYTLALTCDADAEDPGTNDSLSFGAARNVSVQARRTVTANLD